MDVTKSQEDVTALVEVITGDLSVDELERKLGSPCESCMYLDDLRYWVRHVKSIMYHISHMRIMYIMCMHVS